MNTSLQFPQSCVAPNPVFCSFVVEVTAAEAQQAEFMSSTATWPPGEMQRTDGELGKSAAIAASRTAVLPNRLDKL